MRFGIAIFPGTNCDVDCHWAVSYLKQDVDYIWHKETDLSKYDCVILPSGFSYGDYLRTGAIARFSPVMQAITKYAQNGGLVIGICNGFQILLESGLLPGAMLRNTSLKFICKNVFLKVENSDTPFSNSLTKNQVIELPIAHNEGNYYADDLTVSSMIENNQIILRYSNENGDISDNENPNGSVKNIAGICNKERNVFGLMPHPERAMEDILGTSDGKLIFESIMEAKKGIATSLRSSQ